MDYLKMFIVTCGAATKMPVVAGAAVKLMTVTTGFAAYVPNSGTLVGSSGSSPLASIMLSGIPVPSVLAVSW